MTFVDALLSGRVGQIVACNLVDSTDLGVLSKATVRKVVRMAKRMGRSAPPNNDREAVGDLIRAVVATHSYYRSRRLPKSARPRAKLATRQFVTVVPRWLFIKVFKPSALVRNRVYLYRSGGRTQTHQDADFADVEALNGAANVFVPGATIGYFGPVWLADVQDCRGASGADRIRDLFGLVHRKVNEPLIAVDIPGATLSTLRRPSAFDAGDHRRYRARSDQQLLRISPRAAPARYLDEGFTVDLQRFCNSKRGYRLNGTREYVSPPVPLPAIVTWRGLGVTSKNAEPAPETRMDDRFLTKLLRGRKIDLIQRRIEGI